MENENTNKICFSINNISKTFHYENGPVLDIDKLDIYAGEITAVLGYSAAGKSTLMNLLALLLGHDAKPGAEIHYCPSHYQQPYSKLSSHQKRKLRCEHFGFIFQNHHLVKHFSAYNNIMMPLRQKQTVGKHAKEIVAELLYSAGINRKIWNSLPATLSGGESQRISVLRAIAHNPKVLFADEPTGSLDPVTGDIVIKMLREWYEKDKTRTIIVVTHNFNQAYELASRFIIFQNGKIVFDGRKGREISGINDLFDKIQEL
ncbi:MAG: ATP-binding cassette domain-containing protein [Victivallaceae bacterium]